MFTGIFTRTVCRALLGLLLVPVLAAVPRDVAAQVAGELRGRVTDAAESRALPNARIELSGRTDAIRTDANGAYVARSLEPQRYSVTISAVGYSARTFEIDIANGRSTVLDAVLHALVPVLAAVGVRADRDTSGPNVTVFNRARIEQSGQRDLGELLQAVPGLVVTQAGGPGQATTVSIRGSTAGQVLVLVDGVPLNSALTGDADLSQVPLETVNTVTVRTGAQSARYGPRAAAGVIQVETLNLQQEQSALLRTGALGERNVAVATGAAHALRGLQSGASLSADYRALRGDFAYALPALRGGGEATRINSDAMSASVLGGMTLSGAYGSATVRGAWQHTNRGLAGTVIQPSATGRQQHERHSAGATAEGAARSVLWTAAADFTQERGTFVDGSPPFGAAFDDTIRASGVTAAASATVAHHAVTTAVGAELRTLDVTSTMLAPGAPHWQSLVGEWANVRTDAAIAGSQFRIATEVGARLDHNSLSAATGYGSAFSPRVATQLSRTALSLSLSLGAGYAPPTLSDQFFHEGVQVRANPALRAERARHDFEARLGLRETAVSALRVSGNVAAYRSDIDGMILWFPDFRFIWSPSNYDVHRRGLEANAVARLPTAHLEVQGGINRNNVTYAGGVIDGQVTYRPRDSGNVQFSFTPALARLDVTSRYTGTRRTVVGSSLNALAPYWMSDVRLSRVFSPRQFTVQAVVGMENALNASAAMLVDYPFPPRTWTLSVRVRRAASQTR